MCIEQGHMESFMTFKMLKCLLIVVKHWVASPSVFSQEFYIGIFS